MKKIITFLLVAICFSLVSCHDDEPEVGLQEKPSTEENQTSQTESGTLNINVKGSVIVDPSIVSNGDYISVRLTDIEGLDFMDDSEYKGKSEYSFAVEFFIDGNSIGKNSNKDKGFAISHMITDLPLGSHTVTAKCTSGSKLNVTANIASTTINVVSPEAKPVRVTLGSYFHITKDLFDFVTPVITYTDAKGEYKSEITPDMCDDDSFTLDGITYNYAEREWSFETYLVPSEVYNVSISYIPRQNTADLNKRYHLRESFVINKYSYTYNGAINMGFIANIDLTIGITININGSENEPDDGLVGGKYVEEYVKQLCATGKTISMTLGEDGKLLLQ